ncbi:MAG: bifunctional UDP-N-acetylglucosamine diphosphorylase/glucosamine-1-phosphate N-acetyltransferase GlmU, partial [Terriglobales bacterium]
HAVQVALPALRGYDAVLVLHGDMPLVSAATVAGLRAALESAGEGCGAVLATARAEMPRAYGRILRDAQRPEQVAGIVEAAQCTPEQLRIPELNAGFYCFRLAPLRAALGQLGTGNPHGEYYLTDTIAILARSGAQVRAYELPEAVEILGVNDRHELAQVDRLLRRRKALELMAAGVTIYSPRTVAVDAGVAAGEDTILEPGVQLRGATRLGANCRIGAYSVLTDCILADGVVVLPHCVLEGAAIGAGARVGPFTRLREHAEIAAGAHLGNFVEVKKSQVGAGAKAMHLAYLGDARIGERVNIGAGTITCNYDGERKHPTVIGDGTFIGSNSTLVAPLEIAPNAYVGAGSVITSAVPEGALALGRGRQVNKPGWVAARKKKTARRE